MKWQHLVRGTLFMLGMFVADWIRVQVGFPTHLTFTEELIIVCTMVILYAIEEKK